MGRIDIRGSKQLQDIQLALVNADAVLAKQFRSHAKAMAQPEWQAALGKRATTRLERAVIVKTAVVTVTNTNVRVTSAGKGRNLAGGLNPKQDYAAVEYGAKPKRITYQRRGKKGRTHRVTRDVHAQFRPRSTGYVFQPAADAMIPRIVSLYAQTAVRTIGEALEGKG